MANLNSLFLTFNSKITLSTTKKKYIKTGRDVLRKKVKDAFEDNDRKVPDFCGQGSYMMKTIINPLVSNEYDIDDGIYLKGYGEQSIDKWPTTKCVHNWIKNAVDGHTDTSPVDKNTCVRVIYAGDYHIDLPSYIIKDEIAYLAHKDNGWIESDPKAFTDWFLGKLKDNGEQLRSIVKFLKAWKDYKKIDLKGITVTILVSDNFYSYKDRDEKALLGTLTNIIDVLEEKFECKKPVMEKKDLFEDYSFTKKNNIIDALKDLQESLNNAINESDEKKASEYMIKQFGDRFPKGTKTYTNEANKSSYISTKTPGVIKNDGRSA